jgi:hypothetical protein
MSRVLKTPFSSLQPVISGGRFVTGDSEIFPGHHADEAERPPENMSERPMGASWFSGSEAGTRMVGKRS